MSMENVKKFLELVKTDEELARKVVELKDSLQDGASAGNEKDILAERVLPLAKAHGLEFTAEEFLAYANAVSGELSDDDLLDVSGGLSARGVALGLLFATGLSFVPSIISSFATGGGSAPETSISHSYDTELEEDSAMELKEREAEKEVRSSRETVRREGDRARTAQKRLDALKLKLEKEIGTKNINELSKKQKKKFSKLINQIAMAEEDLEATQQKLEAAKGKTAAAKEAKSEVKENNAKAIKERQERKEREETNKNKTQFSKAMEELLKTKKEVAVEAVEKKKEDVAEKAVEIKKENIVEKEKGGANEVTKEENELIAAEKAAEEERIAREKAEQERIAREKAEQERKQKEEQERKQREEEERLRKEEEQRIAAEKEERKQKETITQNLNKIYDLLDELEGASGLETLNRKYDALTLQYASTPDKLKQKENDTKNLLKLVEAKKDLLEINNEIKSLKQNGNDTLALERKYDKVSDMLNKDDANAEKVEESVSALKTSLSNVDNLTKVKFAGNGWLHDGTVENVYNCLKDADFDIDRIENLTNWKTSYQNVLGTMRISTDGQTLEAKAKASSCGTGADDYRHKAMLKTLATFAMEGYKQDGAARNVADPSNATAGDVTIDTGLKEFVESQK